MKTEIDTIKITMTIEEATEFRDQMNLLFQHFSSAVNSSHGETSIEQLMIDYPVCSNFFFMINAYIKNGQDDLPW